MKLKFIKLGLKLFNFAYWEVLGINLFGWIFTSLVVCGFILYTDLNVYHDPPSTIFPDICLTEMWITIGYMLGSAITSYLIRIFKKKHIAKRKKDV